MKILIHLGCCFWGCLLFGLWTRFLGFEYALQMGLLDFVIFYFLPAIFLCKKYDEQIAKKTATKRAYDYEYEIRDSDTFELRKLKEARANAKQTLYAINKDFAESRKILLETPTENKLEEMYQSGSITLEEKEKKAKIREELGEKLSLCQQKEYEIGQNISNLENEIRKYNVVK